MKILQAHKYYFPRDGASNYMLELSSLLQQQGNIVVPFAMRDPQNLPTPYDRFFVSSVDLSGSTKLSVSQSIRATARMFYSIEAKQHIAQVLNEEQIDIVHLHNIYHHISPSILPVVKKKGIPVVMTLHDYHFLSPNYSLYHHGAVHEEDARGWHLSCIGGACVKNSRIKSTLATAEMIFHHKIMRYYERYVDRFIAPSQFMIDLCVKYGWGQEKFVHIPHPVEKRNETKIEDSYVLYHGRLSEEKGLRTLIDAAKETPQIRYKIAGTGPLESVLRERVAHEEIRNVSFVGFQTGQALKTLIDEARLIVVPSVWYENYPLSILEAKASGTVVIGSRIGGIPEMLPDELLVPAGDSHALAQHIEHWYEASRDVRQAMGQRLRSEVQTVNDPLVHVKAIESLYQPLIS